jgi:hypothetical protein
MPPCKSFRTAPRGIPLVSALVILLLSACAPVPATPVVDGKGGSVNPLTTCPGEGESSPAITVDNPCPVVGSEFTIMVTNRTVEHPYYMVSLNDVVFMPKITYDGQIQYGEASPAFEILSAEGSEWELVITLKALMAGEYTFGFSATGIVGGMWAGDGYGSVMINVLEGVP